MGGCPDRENRGLVLGNHLRDDEPHVGLARPDKSTLRPYRETEFLLTRRELTFGKASSYRPGDEGSMRKGAGSDAWNGVDVVTLGGIHCLAGTLVDKVEHGHSILANVTVPEPNGEFVVRDIDDADGVTRFGLSLRALVRERQSLA